MTYRQFNESVDRFAAALQELGVAKGDRVAVHLPKCPQFPIAYSATLRIGGIAVPCNPIYTAREMQHQLDDSGAETIVTLSSGYPLIKQIRADIPLRHVIVAKIKSYFPPITRLLFTLLLERKTGHKIDISGDPNTYWFDDLMAKAPPRPQPVAITGDDTAVLWHDVLYERGCPHGRHCDPDPRSTGHGRHFEESPQTPPNLFPWRAGHVRRHHQPSRSEQV
jgi:long-chain acyl-CoA synthetase